MQRRSAPAATTNDRPPVLDNSRRRSQGNSNSTSKLSALFGLGTRESAANHDDATEHLLAGVQALNTSSKWAAKAAKAQQEAAAHLERWAERTNNNAMGDVVARVGELMRAHADRHQSFAKDHQHYVRQLSKVADMDRRVRVKACNLERLARGEKQLKKKIQKSNECPTVALRNRLDQAMRERELAERELEEEQANAEANKMTHLSNGLIGMANVQLGFAQASRLIAACQRELAEFVPKVASEDVRHMRYEGIPHTRARVAELRRAMAQLDTDMERELAYNAPSAVERRRRSAAEQPPHFQHALLMQPQQPRRTAPQRMLPEPFGTPPPPYTPSAPPFDLLDGTPTNNNHSRRRHPNRHSTGAFLFQNSNIASPPSLYPSVPPNPYAQELEQRMRQQRTAAY